MTEHRFAGPAAAAYDTGRAAYLPEVVAALELPPPPSRVLDLAAGTGLLSRALLAAGHEVVAVEPDPEMAARQPEGVERVAGSAEATGLGDESVDAVVVGDAWHWFDAEAAAAEVHRVLRPRGRLALVWRRSFADERPEALAGYYEKLGAVREHRVAEFREHQERGLELLDAHPGFAPLVHDTVRFRRRTDPERLLAEAASTSTVNAMAGREAFLADLREEVAGVGELEIAYVAEVHRTTRRRS